MHWLYVRLYLVVWVRVMCLYKYTYIVSICVYIYTHIRVCLCYIWEYLIWSNAETSMAPPMSKPMVASNYTLLLSSVWCVRCIYCSCTLELVRTIYILALQHHPGTWTRSCTPPLGKWNSAGQWELEHSLSQDLDHWGRNFDEFWKVRADDDLAPRCLLLRVTHIRIQSIYFL